MEPDVRSCSGGSLEGHAAPRPPQPGASGAGGTSRWRSRGRRDVTATKPGQFSSHKLLPCEEITLSPLQAAGGCRAGPSSGAGEGWQQPPSARGSGPRSPKPWGWPWMPPCLPLHPRPWGGCWAREVVRKKKAGSHPSHPPDPVKDHGSASFHPDRTPGQPQTAPAPAQAPPWCGGLRGDPPPSAPSTPRGAASQLGSGTRRSQVRLSSSSAGRGRGTGLPLHRGAGTGRGRTGPSPADNPETSPRRVWLSSPCSVLL